MEHVSRCPHCQAPVRLAANAVGRKVGCPRCGQPFVAAVTPPVADSPAALAAPAPSQQIQAAPPPLPPPWPQPPQPAAAPAPVRRPSLECWVTITDDTGGVLRGRMRAVVTAEGLHLRPADAAEVLAPVGTPTD